MTRDERYNKLQREQEYDAMEAAKTDRTSWERPPYYLTYARRHKDARLRPEIKGEGNDT